MKVRKFNKVICSILLLSTLVFPAQASAAAGTEQVNLDWNGQTITSTFSGYIEEKNESWVMRGLRDSLVPMDGPVIYVEYGSTFTLEPAPGFSGYVGLYFDEYRQGDNGIYEPDDGLQIMSDGRMFEHAYTEVGESNTIKSGHPATVTFGENIVDSMMTDTPNYTKTFYSTYYECDELYQIEVRITDPATGNRDSYQLYVKIVGPGYEPGRTLQATSMEMSDIGWSWRYTITNYTNKTSSFYYAVVLSTIGIDGNWGNLGDVHILSAENLQPGESREVFIETMTYLPWIWSGGINMYQIQFDSAEELKQFKDSAPLEWIYESYQEYGEIYHHFILDTPEGRAWMNALLAEVAGA